MDLHDAEVLAIEKMKLHGLTDWTFEFDTALRRFGICKNRSKVISLSKHLVQMNDRAKVEDTILHEIAHALCTDRGHGKLWKATCIKIGAKPTRCYGDDVERPLHTFEAICSRCGQVSKRFRGGNGIYCGICYRKDRTYVPLRYKRVR